MKRIKSILTVLMAAVFALSLVPAGAWADPVVSRDDEVATTPATYDNEAPLTSYTISNPENSGHKYEIYQVFTGTPSPHPTTGNKSLVDLRYGTDGKGAAGAAVTSADMALLETIGFTADGSLDQVDIKKLQDGGFLKLTTKTEVASGDTVLDPNQSVSLPSGYYAIKDVSASQDNAGDDATTDGAYTLYLLKVLDADLTIEPKLDKPTIDKQVQDVNDSTGDPTAAYGETADHDIGDAVPFRITSTVAGNIANYTKYHLTVQDDQSAGLGAPEKFTITVTVPCGSDDDVVKTFYMDKDGKFYTDATFTTVLTTQTVGGVVQYPRRDDTNSADDARAAIDKTDKTSIRVEKATAAAGQDFAIKVSFQSAEDANPAGSGLKLLSDELKGATVVIDYESVLNSSAVVGNDGNPNTTYLQYSNNPNDKDDSGEGNEGETPKDTVVVFTYKLDVDKVDPDYNLLSGAGFTLLKKYAELPGGATAGAIDGLTAATAPGAWLSEEGAGSETYWKVVSTISGGAGDSFRWRGIDDGEYRIVETTVPTGYNKADDIDFSVFATHMEGTTGSRITDLATNGDQFQASKDGGAFIFVNGTDSSKTHTVESVSNKEATVAATIVNHSGTELPSTGGIGTTIFYVAGTVLVVGAAVMLVAKRRMGAEA